jgi:hypothetical protein
MSQARLILAALSVNWTHQRDQRTVSVAFPTFQNMIDSLVDWLSHLRPSSPKQLFHSFILPVSFADEMQHPFSFTPLLTGVQEFLAEILDRPLTFIQDRFTVEMPHLKLIKVWLQPPCPFPSRPPPLTLHFRA